MHYAECRISIIIVLNVIMLDVIVLSVFMLNVIMLRVVFVSVMAPFPIGMPECWASHCIYYSNECHSAECHCAECRYAECHYAACRVCECHGTFFNRNARMLGITLYL
jgi:hypothetical protein